MYHIFWKSHRQDPLPAILLTGIWRVDADASYRASPVNASAPAGLAAVRTFTGTGILRYRDGRQLRLQPGDLVFLDIRELTCYQPEADSWKFYWFEFESREPLSLNRICQIPILPFEKELIRECSLNLGSPSREAYFLSQAGFSRLLYAWLSYVPGSGGDLRQNPVALLEWGSKKQLSLPEIAEKAGMCQRTFRKEIHRLTGLSPHAYLQKIKMETAMELLCSTDSTVQQISDSLSFANPYYFSRAFKEYYGLSPSQARQNFQGK